MEPLSVSVARERRHLFVGRASELAALEQWLAAAQAPTRIFHVTGMGGIGKSTLLHRMLERARERGARGLWLDGRVATPTPGGFLAYLSTLLGLRRRLNPERLRFGAPGTPPGRPTLWCIDNYEALEPLHGWLWETLFPELPADGHLLVIASRPAFTERWRTDPGWRSRVQEMALGQWTFAESLDYLNRVGIPRSQAVVLVRAVGRQPLALALAADALSRRSQGLDQVAREAARAVSGALLREAAGHRLGPLLDVLAVVPEADRGLFRQVLGAPLSEEQLLALARLSFVQASPSGFRLHDEIRPHLATDLREQDPERFHQIRRRAARVLIRRLGGTSRERRWEIGASLLALCADALPSVEFKATLSTSLTSRVRTATREDLPGLHRLADGWGRQPFLLRDRDREHRLLDRAVHRFPQWVRVVQGERGEPLAFLATVLLYQDSVAWLEEVEPGCVVRNLPDEHGRLAALPADEADTYLALLVGVVREAGTVSVDELVGLLIRDGLAHLGEGARALVRAWSPDLQGLLHELGFREHGPGAAAGEASAGRLYALDLRSGRFVPWVLSFLQRTDPQGEWGISDASLQPGALRELLKGWQDPAAWEESMLPAALGTDGPALRRRLHRLLTGQERLPPPFTDDDRRLLCRTYLEARPPEVIASDLHVSRATYYRHLARAVERLAQALAEEVP